MPVSSGAVPPEEFSSEVDSGSPGKMHQVNNVRPNPIMPAPFEDLEGPAAAELEDLRMVVGCLGQRVGEVEPQRPKRRIPNQAGADRCPHNIVITNRYVFTDGGKIGRTDITGQLARIGEPRQSHAEV